MHRPKIIFPATALYISTLGAADLQFQAQTVQVSIPSAYTENYV